MNLHNHTAVSMTCVSNFFIDYFMPQANGDYVKVYLYLLRMTQEEHCDFSISSISDHFDFTEGDVLRALRYWEKEHLLSISRQEDGIITDLILLPPYEKKTPNRTSRQVASPHSEPADVTMDRPISSSDTKQNETGTRTNAHAATYREPSASQDNSKKSRKEYSMQELQQYKKDVDYDSMLMVLEGYLGHPLNIKEIQTATFIYKELQFSTDLIYHLYEYCVDRGKYRPEYIEHVAISWAEQNIQTPDQATNASLAYNADYSAVSKAFGMHRMPGKVEQQFIHRWVKEWGFDQSMIVEACNRTLLQISKPDFKYANSILERWHKNNLHTLEEVKKQDADYKKNRSNTAPSSNKSSAANSNNKFNQFPQRNYSKEDYTSLEKRLLAKSRET